MPTLWRLLPAFGAMVFKQRMALKLSADALASATELSVDELTLVEHGHLGPTLPEFFRLSRARQRTAHPPHRPHQ